MKSSINRDEATLIHTTIEAANAHKLYTTDGGKYCIKAAPGAYKTGEEVRVAVDVTERVGEGRRAMTKHIGYAVELHKTTGGGKEYFDKDMKMLVQNYYF